MPYRQPRKSGKGFILPKKASGVHESASGKPVHFKSAGAAKRAGNYIMALENGMIPRKPRKVV